MPKALGHFLVILFALGATASVRATEIFPHLKCPACTPSQMQAKALSSLPNAPGVFSAHVYSLPTGVIRKFEIECITQNFAGGASRRPDSATESVEQDGSSVAETNAACGGTRVVTEQPVDMGKEELIAALHDLYVETGGTMKDTVILNVATLPPFDGNRPTVYDLASSNPLRIVYGQYALDAARQINNGMNVLAEAGLAWVGINDGMQVVITLVARDGGQITYVWNSPNSQAEYKQGSARTAGGQYVPDSPDPNAINNGVWTQHGPNGNSDDLREFADHLRRMGFPVYRGDNPVPPGTVIPGPVTRVTCQQLPDGRFLCKIEVLP